MPGSSAAADSGARIGANMSSVGLSQAPTTEEPPVPVSEQVVEPEVEQTPEATVTLLPATLTGQLDVNSTSTFQGVLDPRNLSRTAAEEPAEEEDAEEPASDSDGS